MYTLIHLHHNITHLHAHVNSLYQNIQNQLMNLIQLDTLQKFKYFQSFDNYKYVKIFEYVNKVTLHRSEHF